MNKERGSGSPCPCGTGNPYNSCCKLFHQRQLPDSALELMRSRYSAYALCLPKYIIATTHPANPQFCPDEIQWHQEIFDFCLQSEFQKLEILNFQEKEFFATVTFVVHLVQNKNDISLSEKSYFEKIKGKWLYLCGQLFEGRPPSSIVKKQCSLLPLAYYDHPILRKVATPIGDISDDIHKLVDEMVETMDIYGGVGLAAPQMHHSIRLFIIRRPIENESGKIDLKEIKVFINPQISMPSQETWQASEGCLSIPSIHAEVERPREITVEYVNLQGSRVVNC